MASGTSSIKASCEILDAAYEVPLGRNGSWAFSRKSSLTWFYNDYSVVLLVKRRVLSVVTIPLLFLQGKETNWTRNPARKSKIHNFSHIQRNVKQHC